MEKTSQAAEGRGDVLFDSIGKYEALVYTAFTYGALEGWLGL